MDGITAYALSKKVAASAVSGVKSMSVDGQTLTINTKDSGVLKMVFPTPSNGVSVTDIDVNANNQIVFTMSDGSEIISGKIPTVKGDKGDPFKYSDFTTEQLDALKGDAGVSPKITENADNTDKIYRLDITTADSTFTTPNLKGADGQGGTGSGEENVIESIKVNGVVQTVADDKSVDITVPTVDVDKNYVDTELAKKANTSDIPSLDGYAKTSEIPSKVSQLENDSNYLSSIPEEYVTDTELNAKGYLTEHQDISGKVDKVEGKSLISDTEIARLASVDNYDDTDIKAEIAKKADTTSIPSKVSELTNDSNYQTAEQVNSTVTTEIAKVVADAPEDLNTLKEMSDWIAGHEDDASAMNSAISDNKTAITALQTGKADKSEIPTTVAELTDSADYAKTADIPETLPANGGNADTVNNHTVETDVPTDAKFTDTTYSDATQIEHGLMSVDDKKKLDGLKKYTPDGTTITADEDGTLHGVAEVTVDDALSDTSTNPVQNKVVKAYVDENVDFSTSTSKLLNDTVEASLVLSKATRNLLIPDLQTITVNGVTCTNNGDGTYTFSGTATDNVFFDINKNIPINKGTEYKAVCFKDENYVPNKIMSCVRRVDTVDEYTFNNGSFVADSENCWLWVTIVKGVTVSNLVAKPMITTDLDATIDDFVPYSGYDIKTCGKNLLNLKKVTSSPEGITASVYNGIITLNGTVDTSISWQDFTFSTAEQYVSLKSGVKYTISTKDKVQKVFILLRESDWGVICSHDCSTSGTTFVASKDVVCHVTITFKESSTFNNVQIVPQIEVGEKATEYEQYQDGGTVHIDSTTEFPLLGLKSFDGETNIISPGNVKCVYPTNESGKGVLDSLYNKDKMLTEQNKNLEVLGKCKNLLNPTLETETHNGVTFTKNDDGTYSLSGSRTDTSSSAYISFIIDYPLEKGRYKLTGALDENNNIRCIIKESGSENKNIYDYGKGVVLDISKPNTTITLMIVSIDDTSQTRIIKPMLTTNLSATYDDFVPYTGDGETLASDVAEIKNDLGGLTFSASGTTLTITDGTNTWTLGANS